MIYSGGAIEEFTDHVTFFVDSVLPVVDINLQTTVGVSDEIRIDASKSFDPDRSGATMNFFYECFDTSTMTGAITTERSTDEPMYDVCRGYQDGVRIIVQDILNTVPGSIQIMPAGILPRGV